MNEAATRKSLLLVDPDPLLRWSIANHLRNAFEIEVAETLEDCLHILEVQGFDAVILSDEDRPQLIQRIEELAKRQNEAVRIVCLITGVEVKPAQPGISYLEKPFKLASLSNALTTQNSRADI